MASASSKVFSKPALVERILKRISGYDSVETLFYLQRVNSLFRNAIRRSSLLQTRMGLRHAYEEMPQYEFVSSGLCPFIGQGKLDLHQFVIRRQWTAETPARIDPTFAVPFLLRYFTTTDDGKVMGIKGRTKRHSNKIGSWRGVKLLISANPVMLQLYIEATAPPTILGRRHTTVYHDVIRFEADQATLGNLVDYLEEVRARSHRQHATIADAASRRPRQ